MDIQVIQNRIYEVRGEKVMLDFDLAQLYEVETRVFNQAVKRNMDSFPDDFMFRLTTEEWVEITASNPLFTDNKSSSQIVMAKLKGKGENLKSQIVMSSWGGRRSLPFAFTEHGVTMLASVLKSPKAKRMNIAIVRAFIALRKMAHKNMEVLLQLNEIRERIGEHDVQLKAIYDAIENLLDDKTNRENWEERTRIGFIANKKP
ncbi:MAG: ORF6N domain-containing protein [Chitinophagaceae bacterium]|nr:ORF6N domain-containing protein [Chitinophagaceae bacterium]